GTDAAIEADHLVSFLDDGAPELIGTGTMRSLAATAADEAEVKPVIAPTPPRTGASPPIAPATGRSPTSPNPLVPRVPSDLTPRSSRISSSNATVASGSFHTIPTTSAVRSRRRRSFRFYALSGLALGIVASSAVVFWIGYPGDRSAAPGGPTTE